MSRYFDDLSTEELEEALAYNIEYLTLREADNRYSPGGTAVIRQKIADLKAEINKRRLAHGPAQTYTFEEGS